MDYSFVIFAQIASIMSVFILLFVTLKNYSTQTSFSDKINIMLITLSIFIGLILSALIIAVFKFNPFKTNKKDKH